MAGEYFFSDNEYTWSVASGIIIKKQFYNTRECGYLVTCSIQQPI